MKTVSYVILLKPSGSAVDVYEDNEIRFTYNLIRIYEMDAREILDQGILCLTPFVPLMKRGPESLQQADALIYGSDRSRTEKADPLTSMAILSGLVSKDLPVQLINRRKDIMIESAAYDIIKQDGIQEGMVVVAREMLLDALSTKFGTIPEDISGAVSDITDRESLKVLHRKAITCPDLKSFRKELPSVDS